MLACAADAGGMEVVADEIVPVVPAVLVAFVDVVASVVTVVMVEIVEIVEIGVGVVVAFVDLPGHLALAVAV